MAKGFWRTSKSMCLLCGASGSAINIYARGHINAPEYNCEECFDKWASAFEKENKSKLLVYSNGNQIKQKSIDIVGKRACMLRGYHTGKYGVVELSLERKPKYKIVFDDGQFVFFNTRSQVKLED